MERISVTNPTDTASATSGIHLGLFDIMQVDPILEQEPGAMYAQRLDDLAFADDAGIEVAFSAERHFIRRHVIPSATAWIAAATQRTTRMRLGMLGYTLPIRQPVQLAEEIAVVDQISGGRLEVGFGLGHRVEELVALGVNPEQRVRLFQERVAVMQALWSGGTVTFDGEGVTAKEIGIWPLTQQEPYPPLWFAGTEPIAAHWMGSRGFGLAVGFKPSKDLVGAVTAWRAGRMAQSEELKSTLPTRHVGALALMRHVYIAETTDRAMDEISDDLVRLNETVAGEHGEGSRADRRADSRARAEELIDTGVMLAGGPDEVARMIREEHETLGGLDLMLANVYAAGVEQERVRRTISLLAGPVREQLAGVGAESRVS
jgi:alkanesulfonate monooxygenase SsuD/methylene tetrahydromethanopterin reductase-like flavin-dependent oxidoreductase (luciferase family)